MTETMSEQFQGVLLRPGDDGYDAARSIWNARATSAWVPNISTSRSTQFTRQV